MEYPFGYLFSINCAKIAIEAGFDLKNRLKIPLNLKKIAQLKTHFHENCEPISFSSKNNLKGVNVYFGALCNL